LGWKISTSIKQKNNIDITKIRADICYYQGKYKCSVRLYEKLYNASFNFGYAIKLINSYIYLGELNKAKRLYKYLYRKYPKNKDLLTVGERLDKLDNGYLESKKKEYEKYKTITSLESYANALFSTGMQNETLELLHNHNKQDSTQKSLLLEAKYLTWTNKTDEALKILTNSSLKSDLEAKFMIGQIYSWNSKLDESLKYFDEVIAKTKDKQLLYDAKKAKAYVFMWQKRSAEAKEMFVMLDKQNPKDAEIKEALMELNHDYAGLIKIYKEKVYKTNSDVDIKRLAQLYSSNHQNSDAIEYFKKYVKNNPDDLEATKELALLLIQNKEYYQGFGYLEYYVAEKKTPKDSILLAKNYYWSGFSKEALDILNELLSKDSKNEEALKLKAKILKISPRFTTSNSGATIGMYFDDIAKKQLFLADTLYFNAHYKASLMYYEAYLKKFPNNHDVRFRYAYSLENAKMYGKAEGEFSLLFWTKDSDELRYHYAYNMMMNGKVKKSKELLKELQNTTYKKLDKNLENFIEKWKGAWQSLDFDNYSKFYSLEFLKNESWSFRKQEIFSTVKYISVGVYEPVYKKLN